MSNNGNKIRQIRNTDNQLIMCLQPSLLIKAFCLEMLEPLDLKPTVFVPSISKRLGFCKFLFSVKSC